MTQSAQSFNPIATFLRSVEGPRQSLGPAPHGDDLARHFQNRDKAGKLELQVDMADYLADAIATQEQAQEALEWMAARWPSSLVARKNHCEGDIVIDASTQRAEALMDLMVNKGADLSKPIQQQEVLDILDQITLSLGEVLVQLGHTRYSPDIKQPKDAGEIEKLARSCARNGDFKNASFWISHAGDHKEKTNQEVWLALSRERTAPINDLALLPDPPANWWVISYDQNTYRKGAEIRDALSKLKPQHFLSNIQAAMLTHNLDQFSDADLVSAMEQQDVWIGENGISGSALEIALAHTVQVSEGRKQKDELNVLMDTTWPMLLARFGSHQSGALGAQEWKDIIEMTKSSNKKELIRSKPATRRLSGEELGELLQRLPKTPHGAPDPSLSFIMGLATTSIDDIATMRRMLPAMRAFLDHDILSDTQIYERARAAAGMTKLFNERESQVKPPNLSKEDASIYIENMLWRFMGSRTIQKGSQPQSVLKMTTQQKSYADTILSLLEEGHYPDWDNATGKRMLVALSSPIMDTPQRIISALEYEALKDTPQVSSSRMGRRL